MEGEALRGLPSTMNRIINGDCAIEARSLSGVDCIITSPPYLEQDEDFLGYCTRTADLLTEVTRACKDNAWMWLQITDPLWFGPASFGASHAVLVQLSDWEVCHEIVLVRENLSMPSRPVAYTHDLLYALRRGTPRPLHGEASSVWNVDVDFYDTGDAMTSFMGFDPAMVRRCVAMATLPGDLVMDPFCGGGIVGTVCEEMGRDFIGIEKVKEAFSVA